MNVAAAPWHDKFPLTSASVPHPPQVTEEELAAAFEFFDMDGNGKITMTNLRKRLSVFYKNMPAKDYRCVVRFACAQVPLAPFRRHDPLLARS